MIVKKTFRSGIQRWLNINATKAYHRLYSSMISKSPNLGEVAEGEEAWLTRWRKYDRSLSPIAYRIFSRYIGNDLNIMPLEICVNMVEPVLTPTEYISYYSDKNSFGKILPGINMPYVYIRNIRGVFFDNDYNLSQKNPLDELFNRGVEKFVLKPSKDASGRGVRIFRYSDGRFVDRENTVFSSDYLNSVYKKDYLLQECVSQSTFFSLFNPTSVNTIRIATYRDVKTHEVHVLRAALRIGRKGTEVDNSHAGGSFVGIDDDGVLGNYLCNQWGERVSVFNDIDFENNKFTIPNYKVIKQFAIGIGEKVIHHDLVAMDITIDSDNNPQLIEINVGGFGGWLFQFTSGTVFGDYTDDVMEFVDGKMNHSELKVSFYRNFVF